MIYFTGVKCAITVGLKTNHASKRKQAFISVVLIFITPIHIRSCKAIDYYRNVGWTSLCSIGIMKQQVEVELVKEALANGSTSAIGNFLYRSHYVNNQGTSNEEHGHYDIMTKGPLTKFLLGCMV